MKTTRPTNRGGYILVSTIWVLAFLSIAAASIGEWYDRSLAVAAGRVTEAHARAEQLSTRATLLYKVATGDLGRSGVFLSAAPASMQRDRSAQSFDTVSVREGIPDIFFDGAVYRGYGELRFSIQDESGLWGLVPETPARTRQLLMSRGVDFQQADTLADRLADYTDEDDLARINGAEAIDYRFAGLEPPPNRRPESIFELKKVMGWDELDAFWEDNSLPNIVTLKWGGAPNPGTAPREVLLRMPGATPEYVDALLAARRGEAEPDADALAWVSELTRQEVFTAMPRPSYRLRMRFWREGERQLREYSVKFLPGDQVPFPWVFENNYRLPLSRDLASETARPAKLPDFVL